MATDTNLTSVILNPWNSSDEPFVNTDQLHIDYSSLGFVASASDSYKSTAGDVFKIYVNGTRIYRTSDSIYVGGTNFLESGDSDNSVLNGVSSQTWSGSTSDTVWTIDVPNQKIIIDTGQIGATSLYGSGGGAAVTFTSGTTIVEVRREVQDQSSPSIDFSNASILTEQDLDNSSANVFHMAQQAVETAKNALAYNTGTSTFQAYQPGTTTKRKITQVADGTATNDAVNKGQLTATEVATLAYKEDTEDYKLEGADWAQKVNGAVKVYTDNVAGGGDLGYSAKAWTIGGTDITDTASAGSAKQWAIGGGSGFAVANKVDGGSGSYASKAYAQSTTAGTDTYGGSAKGWATTAHNTAVPGAGADDRSALHYSTDALNSATAAKNSATAVAQVYDNFSDVYLGAMADSGSQGTNPTTNGTWAKDSSSITVASATNIKVGQVVTGTGMPTSPKPNVLSIDGATVVISDAMAAAGSGVALTFTGYGVYGDYNTSKDGPALNNDGDALVSGNLFFNSTDNEMRIYDGANWIAATSAGSTSLLEYKFVTTSTQVSNKTYTGTADVGGTLSYIQSNVIVFMNGVQLKDGTDYTATNGTSIVLTTAAVLNDEINVLAFKPFTTADMVSASNGGTFSSAVTHNGTVTLNEGITQSETTKNLSGTYSTEKLLLNDSYTLTGDVNVTKHLALGTIADSDVVITNDSSARTITGSGTLEAGRLMNDFQPSLTGMTGELGSTVTGSPNLNLTTGTIGSAVNLNHDAKKNAWHIYRSGTVLYSSNTVLNFDVNALLGSNLTVSGGRVTIGTAGLYWIGCAIGHNGNQVDTDNFHFRINTTMLIGSTLYQSITGAGINYSGISSSFVVELKANDIIDYYGNGYIYGGSGDPMTYFSGCRLGASS